MSWRVGRHYPIHVYEEDMPIATFFRAEDARRAVESVNEIERLRVRLAEFEARDAVVKERVERFKGIEWE